MTAVILALAVFIAVVATLLATIARVRASRPCGFGRRSR